MHASSWATSDRVDTGSRMKEAMPAGRGKSFWWVGWLYPLDHRTEGGRVLAQEVAKEA